LFLDVAAKAIKDARLDISRDVENNIGVYVGAAPNTYLHQKGRCLTTPQTFESHYKSLLDPPVATLAAYKLNLTGPNVTLDTACSSSLTALSLGLTAIREGNCDTALIGGVSIAYPQEGEYTVISDTIARHCSPMSSLPTFSSYTVSPAFANFYAVTGGYVATHGQVFSPSGQCQPFDSRADGAIPADGAAAIIVKRLDDAVRDGDAVYAVLEGHAIGSDGMIEKAGFTVPSATGQSRTVAAAILQSGVSPETIRYVETHGSGTPWGDALEVQGLRQAMNSLKRGGATSDWTLRIGSNKGNFGNAEAASGLLSLIKASLGLSSSVIPPLRELKEPNSMCAFDSRLEPVTKPLSLDLNDRVGVTSLGFGGSNAHVILASAKAYGLASRFI
jgi:acyl transferase domain-containing protein